MGRVLIIKNNNNDNKIHQYAQESYEEGTKRYYNAYEGSINNEIIKDIKSRYDGNGIVLLITYEDNNSKNIIDMFIGSDVCINDKDNIEYIMKIHLQCQKHERVIKSIVDKIDLDFDSDFEYGGYVLMSEMESLYQEMYERLLAQDKFINRRNVSYTLENKTMYSLHKLAQLDEYAIRVYPSDNPGGTRTEFQRDRERVVNCKAFRRLVDKAQIFGSEKGDYFRTRMTHSLEVNQIAKAISYALKLNIDLTEAIALGHDIGHTPFGHQGERTLDDILSGKINVGIEADEDMFKNRCFGGFKHNYQSAKVLTKIEEKYNEFPGLNVSVQVVEGVLKHTKLKPDNIEIKDFLDDEYLKLINIGKEEKQICSSLEGQVVEIADEIAQRGHDVDDALTSGVMSIEELIDKLKINKYNDLYNAIEIAIRKVNCANRVIIDTKELKIARIVSEIVNYFITDTVSCSIKKIKQNDRLTKITMDNRTCMISFSEDVQKLNSYLERVVQKKVICNSEVARADHNANMIVKTLFEEYYKNPRLLHNGTTHKIFLETISHKNKEVASTAVNLGDANVELANSEIYEITHKKLDSKVIIPYMKDSDFSDENRDIIIFEKRRILIRAIVDYIAGMTDGYAIEEYKKLRG